MFRLCSMVLIFSLNCAVLAQENGTPTGTTRSHTLVDVYCGAFVTEPREFASAAAMDSNWELLGLALEEGKLFSSLITLEQSEKELERLRESVEFQKCVEDHAKDLEFGEFIVGGKRIVQQSLQALKEQAKPALLSVSFSIDNLEFREITTDGIPVAIPSLSETQSEGDVGLEELALREQRYDVLWRDFMTQLRQKSVPTLSRL